MSGTQAVRRPPPAVPGAQHRRNRHSYRAQFDTTVLREPSDNACGTSVNGRKCNRGLQSVTFVCRAEITGLLYIGRIFEMRSIHLMCVSALIGCAPPTTAQSWQPPAESARCPSRWGLGDERGSGNFMSPKTVLRASGLIRIGSVYELGHVLSGSIAFFGTRKFDLNTKRTVVNAGANRRGSNEEIVHAEMGQIGTQFDAFSHQTIGDSLYNCFKLDEIATRNGFTRLGVQNVGLLMTRAVLIDVAAAKAVPVLPRKITRSRRQTCSQHCDSRSLHSNRATLS